MSLKFKQFVIAALGFLFLGSLIYVQAMEVERKKAESGLGSHPIAIPATSERCVSCHTEKSPGIVAQWRESTHAEKGVGCVDCHQADKADADAFDHEGQIIATVVTPRDCSRCHPEVTQEFERSHHAKAGNILASLDNFLGETVEGNRLPFDPHGTTPGRPDLQKVNGLASVSVGCKQCHGAKVALRATDGSSISVDDLRPGADGKPTNTAAVARIAKNQDGKPLFDTNTWPNTGIGRLNLDGSRGSCSACHSRHDFSPRRARRPENCGKCHLGPDHPQKEIYEESKHGIAYRDMKEKMKLDGRSWILGKDYSHAPTCATCHMSGNTKNGGKITHDPGDRISWTNRPWESRWLDTDINGKIVTEQDPTRRKELTYKSAADKRGEMKKVCLHCHTNDYVNGFYKQYDDFLMLYNEKFARPGKMIMDALKAGGLISKPDFDDKIEWTWFYLWHHEGRRARHGASMMAPDYAHWHGMYEVAERFYTELIPEAEEIAQHGMAHGKKAEGQAVLDTIRDILARPEHQWRRKAKENK